MVLPDTASQSGLLHGLHFVTSFSKDLQSRAPELVADSGNDASKNNLNNLMKLD